MLLLSVRLSMLGNGLCVWLMGSVAFMVDVANESHTVPVFLFLSHLIRRCRFQLRSEEYVIIDNSQPSLMVHQRYTFSFWNSFLLHTSLDLHKECNERTATPRMNIKARPGLKQLHSQSPPVPPHLSIKVTRIRPRRRPRPAPSTSRILLLLQPRRMISLIATSRRRAHPTTTPRRARIEDGVRILQVRTGRLRRLMGGREIVALAGTERWLLGLVERLRLGVRAGWVVGGRGIVVMMLGLG